MPPRIEVPAHPRSLASARAALHATFEDVARAAGTKPERVALWESGEAKPTLRQLQKAAKFLDRTVASLLIPPPEKSGVPSTPDFRGSTHSVSPKLARELKRAERHRENFRALVGVPDRSVALRPFTWENYAEAAKAARASLEGDGGFTRRELNDWVHLLEAAGILVFQTTGIDLAEFRGASVYHESLPFIVLNGADSNPGRVFSLFHELGHLANRSSGMCLNREAEHEEVLCNRFSASFLAPVDRVDAIVSDYDRQLWVQRLAASCGISELAAAVRLRSLDHITQDEVDEVRRESDERWERARRAQRESDGFVPGWRLRLRDVGTPYAGAVIEAMNTQRISPMDAAYLLETRLPTVDRIADELRRQGIA